MTQNELSVALRMWRETSTVTVLAKAFGGSDEKPKEKKPQSLGEALAMASIHQRGIETERAQYNGG